MSSSHTVRAHSFQRDKTLTIYGRKAVLEALQTAALPCQSLHWASTNKPTGVAADILAWAERRQIEIREHSRESLSRISKNGKQDQGVALDIACPQFGSLETLASTAPQPNKRYLALDGITNPQNVGMIIRSAVAGGIDGILYPKRGVAALGPLVIKASVGTVFRAPLIHCEQLPKALTTLQTAGFAIASLEGGASLSVFDYVAQAATVFVLGGETDGVSSAVSGLADYRMAIPMAGGVESLNVAVAASLIAYAGRMAPKAG